MVILCGPDFSGARLCNSSLIASDNVARTDTLELIVNMCDRGRLDAGQCQVQTLQAQLSVQRQRLRAEEMFRKQVEADYRRLQDEKRTIAAR